MTDDPDVFDMLRIDYSGMGEEDALATLLGVAERRGLLRWRATTPEGFYAISVNDRMFPLLTADEARGAVISIAVLADATFQGLNYRPGLVPPAPEPAGSVDRAPHGQ